MEDRIVITTRGMMSFDGNGAVTFKGGSISNTSAVRARLGHGTWYTLHAARVVRACNTSLHRSASRVAWLRVASARVASLHGRRAALPQHSTL
jgi:hypothetical protein